MCLIGAAARRPINPTNRRTNPERELIRVEQVTCDTNPKYVSNYSCQIRPVATDKVSVNMRAFLREPCNELRMHTVIYYQYDVQNRVLLDRRDDICGYFSGAVKSPLIDAVIDNFVKYSNLNHTCPYQGELSFKADRIHTDDLILKVLLPAGKFHAATNVTNGKAREIVGRIFIDFMVLDRRP